MDSMRGGLRWSAVGWAGAFAALASVTACSDDSGQPTVAADESTASAPDTDVGAGTTTSTMDPPSTERRANVPTVDDTTVGGSTVDLSGDVAADGTLWRLLALGGIEFVVPAGHSVHHDGDMVLIRPSWEPDAGRYLPSAVIALVSQYGSTNELPTVEALTSDAIVGVGTAVPTGTTLELLGHELTGFRFEANPHAAIGPHYLFHALPRPAFGPSSWQPFPLATLFLADTPGGVLAVGAIGRTDTELQTAMTILQRVAPTIRIDDLRSRPADRPVHPSPGDSPDVITPPDDAPAVLLGVVSPVPSGRYTINKLGTPLEVIVPDGWWVQGNFAGHVVLSGDESFGPGDRAVTFHTGIDRIVAVSSDYAAIGEPLPLAADTPWPTDRFPTLIVGPESEVDLNGVTARRFDVRVDPDADCSEAEPCEFHLLSAHFPPGETIRKGYANRIWELSDGVSEPITIIAVAADESWLAEADAVVRSIRFDW